jgi:hypothetical protein
MLLPATFRPLRRVFLIAAAAAISLTACAPATQSVMPKTAAIIVRPPAPPNVPHTADAFGQAWSIAPPAGEITVTPANWLGAVQAAPSGAVIVFSAGMYPGAAIVPKDNQQYFGQRGAILDGQGRTASAFTGAASNVRISNFQIQSYADPAQVGAIMGDNTTNWEIDHNNVWNNAGTGIRVGNATFAHDNFVHHNRQLGMGGGGVNITVQHNEISDNNYSDAYDPGWEAGGAKFVMSNNLVVKSNLVHNNVGPGLWTDIGNVNTLYDSNYVYDNNYNGAASSAGIFHEISGSAVIRNNVVVHNGTSWNAWAWNGGIQIAASSDVQIYDNQVLDNPNGITLLQQSRYSEWAPGVRNISVHDNIIRTNGVTGAVEDTGENIFNGSRNIHFTNNTYLGPTYDFAWNDTQMGAAQWKTTGNDATATFK